MSSWQLITPGTESAIALIASGAIAISSPEPENDRSRTGQQLPRPAVSRQLTRLLERLSYQASLEPVTANSSLV